MIFFTQVNTFFFFWGGGGGEGGWGGGRRVENISCPLILTCVWGAQKNHLTIETVLFLFDSLCPINNLSVIKGRSSWVVPVLS